MIKIKWHNCKPFGKSNISKEIIKKDSQFMGCQQVNNQNLFSLSLQNNMRLTLSGSCFKSKRIRYILLLRSYESLTTWEKLGGSIVMFQSGQSSGCSDPNLGQDMSRYFDVSFQGCIPECLVAGWATPLKNMSSSIGMIRNPLYDIWENVITVNQTTNQNVVGLINWHRWKNISSLNETMAGMWARRQDKTV